MNSQYEVSTTLGDTLVDEDGRVWVQVSRNRFLRKSPRELNNGELVLFCKPYTKTELDDVTPYLERSPRYTRANETLYERNSRGEYVPRLRTLLIRGLAQMGVVQGDDIKERVMFETDRDFTPTEYQAMQRHIINTVTESGYSEHIPETNIENWLRGETRGPRNWKIFRPLEKINPEFRNWVDGDQDPKSTYFNHRLLWVINQQIMRYLNNWKGTTVGTEESSPGDSKISLSPEYQIVLGHFLKDVTMDLAAARVNGVRKLIKSREVDHVITTNTRLCDGIVTRDPHLAEKSYRQTHEDMDIVEGYFTAAVEDYFDLTGKLEHIRNTPQSGVVFDVVVSSLPFVYEMFGERLDDEMLKIKSLLSQLERSCPLIHNLYASMIDSLLLGDMDRTLRLDRGSLSSLLEVSYRLRNTLPRPFFSYLAGDESKKRIVEAHGLKLSDPSGNPIMEGVFLSEVLDWHLQHQDGGVRSLRTARNYLKRGKVKSEVIKRIIKESRRAKKLAKPSLRTRRTTRRVLEEHGLENLLFLRESDFVWEQFV